METVPASVSQTSQHLQTYITRTDSAIHGQLVAAVRRPAALTAAALRLAQLPSPLPFPVFGNRTEQ